MNPQVPNDFDENVDTLVKFGPTFQAKVLANMLVSPEFLHQSLDILNPNFFDTDAAKWIVKKTMTYFGEYKAAPTLEVFKIELGKEKDGVLQISVKEHLRAAYNRKSDEDLTYVKDSFLNFAKNQALKSAIVRSVDLLQIGQYGEIKTIIDKALRAGQPRNIGHDWKEDVALRLNGKARKVIPTGWDIIDQILGGGLGGGELGCVAAPSGIGKSWVLSTIGANAARAGYRVVHYTLELNENYVGLRYDSVFTGIEPGLIPSHPQVVHDMIRNISGDVIMKYYAPRTITVHTIHAHLENLIANRLKPDLIIVDYADLMRSVDRADARYQELGAIYEELRGLAGELDLPCWTASQTQRSSIQDDVIQADKISDSYSKIMTADFVVSVSRKLEDKANHTARAHVIKNRFGIDGITLPMYMNTAMGKVEIFDENSAKGAVLTKQMSGNEGMLRKTLAKKFADLQSNILDDD